MHDYIIDKEFFHASYLSDNGGQCILIVFSEETKYKK